MQMASYALYDISQTAWHGRLCCCFEKATNLGQFNHTWDGCMVSRLLLWTNVPCESCSTEDRHNSPTDKTCWESTTASLSASSEECVSACTIQWERQGRHWCVGSYLPRIAECYSCLHFICWHHLSAGFWIPAEQKRQHIKMEAGIAVSYSASHYNLTIVNVEGDKWWSLNLKPKSATASIGWPLSL